MAHPKPRPPSTSLAAANPADIQAQQAAFDHYAPDAAALPEDKVKVRMDVNLAQENVRTAISKVLAHVDALQGLWSSERIAGLSEVQPLAMAAVYAEAQAELAGGPSGVKAHLSEAFSLSDMMFSALETCAKFGVIPQEDVDRLNQRRGPLHLAQSLINLADYWQNNEVVLANKTPATAANLSRSRELGNLLNVEIKPTSAHKREDPAVRQANDTANRYWTLLVNGFIEVRKAAFEIWGPGYEKEIPALQSRVVKRKKSEQKTPEPPPAPAPDQTKST